jgi:hypothetical protein
MDEDNTSTDVVEETTQPVDDPVLAVLGDTDDDSTESVEETPAQEESETETESEVEPTEEEESEETAEESEEIDPKEEARRRYEERQRVIAERRERVQEQTKDYVEQSEDEYDQRLRQMEVQEYTRTIENNENTLISEFERAKNNPDLQIFNPDSELFNEKAYDKAMRDYNAGYIGYDRNGNMVEIKGSLFEHLTETAELLKGAIKSGAVQQVRDSRKTKASADTKPAAPPKEQAKDPILDILTSDD